VVAVTLLEDSGPGTLREALSSGNRRIIFSVGGVITLHSRLDIRGKSFITIDGATAPDPGITLEGNTLYIRTSHDIIVTHMRLRNSISDGILIWDGSHDVVIDQCSVTNASDENINITEDTSNVTVSWCIIGDTRPNSFDLHTKGMLIANFNKPPVTHVSLHHNLFINEFQRSPQISSAGLFDVRNNVIWNWGSYGIRIRNGAAGNLVNNVFATHHKPGDAIVLAADAGPVYIQGNLGSGTEAMDTHSTTSAPFVVAPVATDPIDRVERRVLQEAGAFPRDAIDRSLAGAVNPVNGAPIADAGSLPTSLVGQQVSFDGSGSSDPDGDALSYRWELG